MEYHEKEKKKAKKQAKKPIPEANRHWWITQK